MFTKLLQWGSAEHRLNTTGPVIDYPWRVVL